MKKKTWTNFTILAADTWMQTTKAEEQNSECRKHLNLSWSFAQVCSFLKQKKWNGNTHFTISHLFRDNTGQRDFRQLRPWFWTISKARTIKSTDSEPVLLISRASACFQKPGVYSPGRLKHGLCVVLDEKAQAFGKTSKT
jgi:hypothetical protein